MHSRTTRTAVYADPNPVPVAPAAANPLRRVTRASAGAVAVKDISAAVQPAAPRSTLGDITNRRPSSGAAAGAIAAKPRAVAPAGADVVKPTAVRRPAALSLTIGAGAAAPAPAPAAVPSLALPGNALSRTASSHSISGALSARAGALPALVAPKAKLPEAKAPLGVPSRPSSAQSQYFDKENFPTNSNAAAAAGAGAAKAQPFAAFGATKPLSQAGAAYLSGASTAAASASASASAVAPPGGMGLGFGAMEVERDGLDGDDDTDAMLSARASKLALYSDVDAADLHDAQNAADYIQEIHAYFKRTEGRRMADANYMARQPDLNANMREKLIDWLVDVHLKFKLRTETMYLCVNYLDRFLERKATAKVRLQLVGMVALLIAAKYEEIYVPEIEDFVYICAKAFNRQQMLEMEQAMLSVLEFNLTIPTPLRFMQRYSRLAQATEVQEQLSAYLCECTLQDMRFLRYLPSCVGAACVYLARVYTNPKLTGAALWTPVLAAHSEFSESDATFAACVRDIHALAAQSKPKYMAVRRKFADKKYGAVSTTIKPVAPPLPAPFGLSA